jgi:3-mercaptopyruvate sulfurtransferase SseA
VTAQVLVDPQRLGGAAAGHEDPSGIDPDQPPRELIATRGSGVSATVAMMALERIGVRCDGVYDGSFNESSADAARPVAYGAAG